MWRPERRAGWLVLVAALTVAPLAYADEAIEAVAELRQVLADEAADWDTVNAAYGKARDALQGGKARARAADKDARRAIGDTGDANFLTVYDSAQTALTAYGKMLGAHGAEAEITRDTQASFEAAKAAVAEAAPDSGHAEKAMHALEVGEAAVLGPLAYDAIRPQVADRLRRTELPAAGWVMGLFAAALLWGGLAWCIRLARRSRSGPGAEEAED